MADSTASEEIDAIIAIDFAEGAELPESGIQALVRVAAALNR